MIKEKYRLIHYGPRNKSLLLETADITSRIKDAYVQSGKPTPTEEVIELAKDNLNFITSHRKFPNSWIIPLVKISSLDPNFTSKGTVYLNKYLYIVNYLIDYYKTHKDFKLKVTTCADLIATYGENAIQYYKDFDADQNNQLKQYNITSKGYTVEHISDFESSYKLGSISGIDGNGRLCFTDTDYMWTFFTNKGANKCYVLLAPNYDKIKPIPSEGHPYDTYGLSMVWLFIAPDGSIAYSNLRWNHMNNKGTKYNHHGLDNCMTKIDVAKMCGVDVNKECPPFKGNSMLSEEKRRINRIVREVLNEYLIRRL